jgi:hypothetical protein
MRPNLDSLTEEIQHYLETEHFVTFRSRSRLSEEGPFIAWDTGRFPDFRQFLDCAAKLGVRLLHFHQQEFSSDHRQSALEMLEEAELSKEDKRDLERRLEEFVIYEGFLCAIELTFDFDGRIYLFALETEWFEEWQDLMDEIEEAAPNLGEESDPYGGYYSSN